MIGFRIRINPMFVVTFFAYADNTQYDWLIPENPNLIYRSFDNVFKDNNFSQIPYMPHSWGIQEIRHAVW